MPGRPCRGVDPRIVFIALVSGLSIAATRHVHAQGPKSSESSLSAGLSAGNQPAPVGELESMLPSTTLLQRLRPVGVYGAQLAKILPADYRPIAVDELNAALVDEATKQQGSMPVGVSRCDMVAWMEDQSVLVGVGRMYLDVPSEAMGSAGVPLAMDDSEFDSSSNTAVTSNARRRYSLGRPGIAIRLAQPDAMEASLVTEATGEVTLLAMPGTPVDFRWKAWPNLAAAGAKFDFALPKSTVNRLWIAAEPQCQVTSTVASIEQVVAPPRDVQLWALKPTTGEQLSSVRPTSSTVPVIDEEASGETDRDWFKIEAAPGAASQWAVTTPGFAKRVALVRGCRLDYFVEKSGVRWESRFALERDSPESLPPIGVGDSVITKVVFREREMPYRVENGWLHILPTGTDGDVNDGGSAGSYPLVIQGWARRAMSDQRAGEASILFPVPDFSDPRYVVFPAEWQASVSLVGSDVISNWSLPQGWTVTRMPNTGEVLSRGSSNTTEAELAVAENVTTVPSIWRAKGPPVARVTAPSSVSDRSDIDDRQRSVASLEATVSARRVLRFANHQIRFELTDSEVQVKGRVRIDLQDRGLVPIRLRLQREFQLDSIVVLGTQRQVEIPPRSNLISIWPRPNDVVGNAITLRFAARAPRASLSADRSRSFGGMANEIMRGAETPLRPLWALRVLETPGRLTALVVPTATASLSIVSTMDRSRLSLAELRSSERQFFAPIPGDAVAYGGSITQTPGLSFRRPDFNLQTRIRTALCTTDGEDLRQVVSESEMEVEGRLSNLPRHLQEVTGIPSRRYITVDFPLDSKSSSLAWFYRPSENAPLLPIDPTWVKRAASNDGASEQGGSRRWEVGLPDEFDTRFRLVVRQRIDVDDDEMRVGIPTLAGTIVQSSTIALSKPLEVVSKVSELAGLPVSAGERHRQEWRMRQPGLLQLGIRGASAVLPPPIIARVDTHWTASAGGVETLVAEFASTLEQDLDLVVSPTLRARHVSIDGEPQVPSVLPGIGLRIPHESDGLSHQVRIQWIRSNTSGRRFRSVDVPPMRFSASVLQVESHIHADADSFLLTLPLTSRLFVVQQQAIWSLGIVLAWLILAISLVIVTVRPGLVIIGVVLSVVAAVFWLDLATYIACTITLPLILAGLIKATWRQPTPLQHGTSNRRGQPMISRLWKRTVTAIAWMLMAPLASVSAQVPSTSQESSAENRPLVLIPVNPDGTRMGDKVYIPQRLFDDLFRQQSTTPVVQPSVLQAAYTLKVEEKDSGPSLDTPASRSYILEARWTLEVEDPRARMQLPIASPLVVEVQQEDSSAEDGKPIGWYVEQGDRVVLAPLNATRVSIIASYQLTPVQVEGRVRLEMPLAPCLSSTLRLETELDSLDARWQAISGRWQSFPVTDAGIPQVVGPLQTLIVEFASPVAGDASLQRDGPIRASIESATMPSNTWRRQVWVHIGQHESIVQCEMHDLGYGIPNDSLRFRLARDAFGDAHPPPELVGSDWEVVLEKPFRPMSAGGSGDGEAQREEPESLGPADAGWIGLRRRTNSNEPVRLVWVIPHEDRLALPLGLPHVTAIRDLKASETRAITEFSTWIAQSFAAGVETAAIAVPESQSLPIDQFYAAWTGYLSPIAKAASITGSLANFLPLRLAYSEVPPARCDCVQSIHISSSEIETEAAFQFQLPLGVRAESGQAFLVEFPSGMELLRYRFIRPGQSELSDESPTMERDEALVWLTPVVSPSSGAALATQRCLVRVADTTATLVVTGRRPIRNPRNAQALPIIDVKPLVTSPATPANGMGSDVRAADSNVDAVENSVPGEHKIIVSRSSDISVQWHRQPPPTTGSVEVDDGTLLAAGRFPLGTWESTARLLPAFGECRLRVAPRSVRTAAKGLVTLRYRDGRWVSTIDVKVTSKGTPDYLDFEIPTRWSESIRVTPTLPSVRQPTADPATQVLRVRLNEATDDGLADTTKKNNGTAARSLQLESRLASGDSSRVSVPMIRLIGDIAQRWYASVPKRVGGEAITWRRTNVDANAVLPPPWKEEPARLAMQLNGRQWAVELQTVNQSESQMQVLSTSHQLILAGPNITSATQQVRRAFGLQPTSKTGLELPTSIARSWPGRVQALNRRRVACDQLL
ncbi:MAG: hypothetical protein AAGD07_03125, partial [Planctomycetota bacterium]